MTTARIEENDLPPYTPPRELCRQCGRRDSRINGDLRPGLRRGARRPLPPRMPGVRRAVARKMRAAVSAATAWHRGSVNDIGSRCERTLARYAWPFTARRRRRCSSGGNVVQSGDDAPPSARALAVRILDGEGPGFAVGSVALTLGVSTSQNARAPGVMSPGAPHDCRVVNQVSLVDPAAPRGTRRWATTARRTADGATG